MPSRSEFWHTRNFFLSGSMKKKAKLDKNGVPTTIRHMLRAAAACVEISTAGESRRNSYCLSSPPFLVVLGLKREGKEG